MDEIERRIAAIVRHAIESGEVIEVFHEAHRLARSSPPTAAVSERDIAEALADCAAAARVPLQMG